MLGIFCLAGLRLLFMDITNNVVWYHVTVTRERRELLTDHRAGVVWFTGLFGSGKSTLVHAVEEQGYRAFVFDGDNVRHGLCFDLGFSAEDRSGHIRRIAEMVRLFLDAGIIALCAFSSPMRVDRQKVSAIVGAGSFLKIHGDCSV